MMTLCSSMNLQSWMGVVVAFSLADGTPKPMTPHAIAFCLSQLKTSTGWMCVAEENSDGLPHYHILIKTTSRSDSMRNQLMRCWNVTRIAGLEDIEGPEINMDLLKLQAARHPQGLLEYILKNPIWICSHSDIYLDLMHAIWWHHKGDRFLRPRPPKERHKQNLEIPIEITRDLLEIIYENNCKTAEQVFRANPELIVKYLHRPGFNSILQNCIMFASFTKQTWTLESNAKQAHPDPGAIHEVLSHQDIDIDDFDWCCWQWINMKHTKKNTMILYGPSNTGKSKFIAGLRGLFQWGEIVNGGMFMFEDLTGGKNLGIWEEPLISSEAAEKVKQVFEGETTSVPIKYRAPRQLDRMPIIVTTNHYPWRFCSSEEQAFRNRSWIFEFWQDATGGLIHRSSSSSCECRSCSRRGGGADATDPGTASEVPGGEQPIQPLGRRNTHGCGVGGGSTGPMRRPTTGSEPRVARTPSPGRGDHRGSDENTGGAESGGAEHARSGSGSGSTTEHGVRPGGDHGPGDQRKRVRSTRTWQPKPVEPRQHRGGDDAHSGGDGHSGGTRGREGDANYIREQCQAVQNLVGLLGDSSDEDGGEIQTKKQCMDRKVAPIKTKPPTKYDWEQYLSYLSRKMGI
nr:MAG: nonstructural protein [Canine parvovirus]